MRWHIGRRWHGWVSPRLLAEAQITHGAAIPRRVPITVVFVDGPRGSASKAFTEDLWLPWRPWGPWLWHGRLWPRVWPRHGPRWRWHGLCPGCGTFPGGCTATAIEAAKGRHDHPLQHGDGPCPPRPTQVERYEDGRRQQGLGNERHGDRGARSGGLSRSPFNGCPILTLVPLLLPLSMLLINSKFTIRRSPLSVQN